MWYIIGFATRWGKKICRQIGNVNMWHEDIRPSVGGISAGGEFLYTGESTVECTRKLLTASMEGFWMRLNATGPQVEDSRTDLGEVPPPSRVNLGSLVPYEGATAMQELQASSRSPAGAAALGKCKGAYSSRTALFQDCLG